MHSRTRAILSAIDRILQQRFSVLALSFAVLFVAIGGMEYLRARAAFDREMQETLQALKVGVRTTLEVTEREVLAIAAYVASDPAVQRLMRQGRAAIEEEGGAGGNAHAATVRAQLMALMGSRWDMSWSDNGASRLLEFHLARGLEGSSPDAVTFLRVREPEYFGDSLKSARPMVIAANTLSTPVSGFEVGRFYSGIRGVHPVFLRGSDPAQAQVGSVEVGIAFLDVLRHVGDRFDAHFALTLPRDMVHDVMWAGAEEAGFRYVANCQCYLDAPPQSVAGTLFDKLKWPDKISRGDLGLQHIEGRWYGVSRVGLPDYLERENSVPESRASAKMFVFTDRSDEVEAYRVERVRAVLVFTIAYLIALMLAWLVLRRLVAGYTARISLAEEALASAQRFGSALFNLAPDSVLVTDREGVILEVNPRFCEVTGYRAEEVVGRKPSVFKSGETPHEVYRELWGRLLAGEEWRGDLLNRRKDGTFYWEAHAIVPVRDAQGEITQFVSFQRDISRRREIEQALAVSERLYRSIFDNVEEAIFLIRVEADGFRYVGSNRQHDRSTGLTAESMRGARPEEVLSPEVAAIVCANYRRCLDTGTTLRYEESLDLPAGRRSWLTTLSPVRSESGAIELIVGLSIDMSEQKSAEAELRRLATTDVLTGLANRRHFLERAEQELERVRRYGKNCAFLMLDVDHFKRINDTWGHACGDAVLRVLADVLTRTSRATDLVGRLGGEEFALILPETELDAALVLAERLRVAVSAERLNVEGETLTFSASFGVTALHGEDEDIDMPMARADRALYAAKSAGRNRVESRVR